MRAQLLLFLMCVTCVGCGRPPWCPPPAISDAELNAMDLPFAVGDEVQVKSGPYKGHVGTVEYIDGFTGTVLYRVRMPDDSVMQHFESSVLSLFSKRLSDGSYRPQPPEQIDLPFLPNKRIGS